MPSMPSMPPPEAVTVGLARLDRVLSLDDAWLRPRPTRTQVRNDVIVGLALVGFSLLSVELLRSSPAGDSINERLVESYLWGVATVAPLAVRRLFPITVMLLCSIAFYGAGERTVSVGASVVVQIALFSSIYTAWAWSRHRRALLAWSTLVVVGMFLWLVQIIVEIESPALDAAAGGIFPPAVAVAVITLGLNVVYFFGAIAWGLAAHRAARQREQLEQQTEELRRERDLSARRAVVEERLRIARDLHDVVAHHVTGIGVQAAAAGHVLERDPGGSREALAAIEQSSRSAVREMHQLVGLLRSETEESDETHGATAGTAADPQLSDHPTELTGVGGHVGTPLQPGPVPSLAGLAGLAASFGRDGLDVELREVGARFDVPPGVATSAYRTVQEALTNVRRHSTARSAEVVLRYVDAVAGPDADGDPSARAAEQPVDRAVEVEVLDAGTPRSGSAGARGTGGFGLRGIRERTALHGGRHEIGPRPGQGFRVRVRLPVDDPIDPGPTGLGSGAPTVGAARAAPAERAGRAQA
jgi:signal transduction histidine kinase